MSSVRRLLIIGVRTLAVVTLCNLLPAHGQAGAQEKPLMAEDVFKNVQVLKGIPVNQFMETMGFFSAALGYNCTNCHGDEVLGNWEKYAVDIPLKRTARRMIQVVNTINKDLFGGREAVTCYTCHRGSPSPKVVPSLLEQYSQPPEDDPNEVEISRRVSAAPAADEILNRYIQALGGAGRLAALTSFVGKGSYEGFDSYHGKVAGSRVKLFFDKETGLLSRVVRYSKTIVGSVPIQMDYSDYREVAGVKMPFQWRLTWTDGQSMYILDDVQPNVAIDPAKFAKPVAPAAPVVAPAKVVR